MKSLLVIFPLLLCTCCKAPNDSVSTTGSDQNPATEISYHKLAGHETKMHYIIFSASHFSIEVADQNKGPGTQWFDAKAAAKAHQGLAAINAGFFTPEGKPLGICIDDGKKAGGLNRSSLGSGALVVGKNGEISLIRRSKIDLSKKPTHLLQSGPFLVDAKKPVMVKPSEVRPRSFIAWDGKSKWLIGHVENISLPVLAQWLSEAPFDNFSVWQALNLDGGRSCQMYLSQEITGEEKQITTFMNRRVRNFLVVKKK